MSAPSANADDRVVGQPELAGPDEHHLLVQAALRRTVAYTRLKPSRNGSATESVNTSGDAPVPPSPPSMLTKSTPRPVVGHQVGQLVPELHVADGAT